jgi:hypothetical protein
MIFVVSHVISTGRITLSHEIFNYADDAYEWYMSTIESLIEDPPDDYHQRLLTIAEFDLSSLESRVTHFWPPDDY